MAVKMAAKMPKAKLWLRFRNISDDLAEKLLTKLDDVIGGTAVLPEWNNFQYLHEYTIPEGITIKSWKGKTARQPVSYQPDGTPLPSNYHLSGGDEQLFISFIKKQDPDFEKIVTLKKVTW